MIGFSPITAARRVAERALDAVARVLPHQPLLPPLSLRRMVGEPGWQLRGEDFFFMGCHLAEKLQRDAGLCASSQVLDLGSGCGRLAVPLTRILAAGGSYVGIEVSAVAVAWCRQAISAAYPNFEFLHSDIHNSLYNPRGTIAPGKFVFPVNTGSFDVVIASSIFTHLLPAALANYFAQCARALRPRGRLFATFFLQESGLTTPTGDINFAFQFGDAVRVADLRRPEAAISYSAEWLTDLAARSSLRFVPPARLGSWTGRPMDYTWQDVMLFEKI